MTLRDLFTRHGLTAYVDAFEREHVSLDDLAGMSDQELGDVFGVRAYGDRKRFRAMVAELGGGAAPAPAIDSGATRMGIPATDPGATRMGPPPADTGATRMDAAPSWPTQIGNYRILGLVGQGGMGTVLRARHIVDAWAEKQGGDVAIKLIHPHLASDPAFQRRFIDEAGLGRSVSHAGLVPVYDVVADGAWLGSVMGFVSGEPLSGRVRPGGLPLEEVLRVLGPVGETLDFLHAQGIVHRDVKPANIVVRPDGRPVLLDLGIAKDTRAGGESHTRTLTAMGTSAWMAPEQADAKNVDGAADRYAFGLMAYALLAGRMPWGADTSELAVVVKKATGQLDALSGVPAHVGAAVMRMLSVSAGERYPNCAAFVEALRRDGEGEKRAAAERAARERAEREARERAAKEQQAREKAAQEAKERAEREKAAREKAEREARERAAKEQQAREEAERIAKAFPFATPEHAARTERLSYRLTYPARTTVSVSVKKRVPVKIKKMVPVEVTRDVVVSEGFLGFGRKVEQRLITEHQEREFIEHEERDVVEEQERIIDQEIALTMIVIPPCRFTMGSPPSEAGRFSAETQHEVRLTRAYAMATTPVTQALYQAVMGTNPSKFKDGAEAPQRPVEQVSWFDAVRFCNALSAKVGLRAAYEIGSGDAPSVRARGGFGAERLSVRADAAFERPLGGFGHSGGSGFGGDVRAIDGADGFRLPTEAEWECAARAGTAHVYAGGDDLDAVGWYDRNSGGTTHAVAQKRANAWGLHDMSGNVWEWCQDWAGDYTSGVVTDPQGAASGSLRVFRGGCWNLSARNARVARRGSYGPALRGVNLGFRLTRTYP